MTICYRRLAQLLVLAALFSLTGCGGKESSDLKAKVLSLTGKVEIKATPSASFVEAKANDVFGNGGIIKTGEESLADLEIIGKGVVKMRPDSSFELEAGKDYVLQNSGAAVYKIEKGSEGFRVKSPHGVTCVLGTQFIVRILDNMTVVGVEEGRVSVTTNNGEMKTLEAKQKLSFADAGFIGEPGPFDLLSDSFNYIKIDGKWVPAD